MKFDKIFFPAGNNTATIATEIAAEVAKQTEETILTQLNDFISRGLLVVESTRPIFVHEPDSAKLKVMTAVKLKLKDLEYIESLERQLAEMRDLVSKLRGDPA